MKRFLFKRKVTLCGRVRTYLPNMLADGIFGRTSVIDYIHNGSLMYRQSQINTYTFQVSGREILCGRFIIINDYVSLMITITNINNGVSLSFSLCNVCKRIVFIMSEKFNNLLYYRRCKGPFKNGFELSPSIRCQVVQYARNCLKWKVEPYKGM